VGIAATVALAAGAFTLSFTALTDLATNAGIRADLAWIWPLIVDGLVVAATVAVVALSGRRERWYPWLLLVSAAAASIAANAYHAAIPKGTVMPPSMAAAVSSVPPVVLLAVTHLTVILTRRPEAVEATAESVLPDGTVPRPLTVWGLTRAVPYPDGLVMLVVVTNLVTW